MIKRTSQHPQGDLTFALAALAVFLIFAAMGMALGGLLILSQQDTSPAASLTGAAYVPDVSTGKTTPKPGPSATFTSAPVSAKSAATATTKPPTSAPSTPRSTASTQASPTANPGGTRANPTATAPAGTAKSPPPTSTQKPPVQINAQMASPDFGAQAFLWWRPEVADRDLTIMKEFGFSWVRQTFAWEDIEGKGKGQFDWANADRVIQQVNDHGLKLLARLGTDPENGMTKRWAGPPPGNAKNFADFAGAMAKRYCGKVQAYQVWNEPNLTREWGGRAPNPTEYANFLRGAYTAIKAACPSVVVVTAGMAPTERNEPTISYPDAAFYEGMYKAMKGNSNGYFDVLGAHAAGFAAPPELDPAEAAAQKKYGGYRFFSFRHLEDIRAIMVRYGDANKRIAILEFGWTFDRVNPDYKWHGADAGIDDYAQGCFIVRAYDWAKKNWQPWIGLMSVLTMPNLDWIENGKDPQKEEQYWWAIMEPSRLNELHLRPAIVMIKTYVQTGVIEDRCKTR
ncbi:MAG: beta-galactosidase [Anaerolineae bacterium]|nr:beta-galactosidase [Anaerolineae bacterium]